MKNKQPTKVKLTGKMVAVMILMGLQALFLGTFISEVVRGRTIMIIYALIAGGSCVLFFKIYKMELDKQKEEISIEKKIEGCWEQAEEKKGE